MAVLATATGLAHEAPLDLLDALADRLPVGDLGTADVGVDVELAQQAVDDHLEVELAHPVDQGLPGLLVGLDLERRVLLGEPREAGRELLLVGLVLGSMATAITGSGNSISSSSIGASGAASVSPVPVCFSPTPAQMSPA